MESSFERVLPPRERLELVVNGLFAEVNPYEDAGCTTISAAELTQCRGCGNCEACEHVAENPSTYEVMLIPHEQTDAVVVREVDNLGVTLTYVVGVRDRTQLSYGMAGLAWRPHDSQLPPRLFDQTRVSTDDDEITTTLLADWLRAQAAHQEEMPPNPFNRFYEAQEVTLASLDGEDMSDQDLGSFLHLGIVVAARMDDMYDMFRTLAEPILPPAGYLLPTHVERPEQSDESDDPEQPA